MKAEHYRRLVDGYLQKTLTKDELAVFFALLHKGELDAYIEKDMVNLEMTIAKRLKKRVINNYIKYAAAAVVVISLTALMLFKFNSSSRVNVLPGSEYAELIMADGTKMILDTGIKNGVKAANGLILNKLKDGTLQYDFSKLHASEDDILLTQNSELKTPRGGVYQMVLSDGTRVWLNASSKIKFPLLFNDDTRTVELEGEVYFEVAHDKYKPFIVKFRNQEVKVLGTKFNVNAYENEVSTKTSLQEGSIQIKYGKEQRLIAPGQMAQVKDGIIVKNVEDDKSTSWKDGFFDFDKLYVKEIMRQVERWYNIDIVYDKSFKDERFVAKIKRSASIDDMITIFNEGGLKVSLTGTTLHVSNNK